MHKQRLFMLIAAAIGALACFLPWMNAPILGSVAGTQGSDGYVCLGLFAGAGAFALLGDRAKPLSTGLGVGSSLWAAGAMAIGVWKIVNVQSITGQMDKSNPLAAALASSVGVGIGLYLVVVTGAAVPVLFGFMRQPVVPTKPSSAQKPRKKRRRDNQREELPEEMAEEVEASPSAPSAAATRKKKRQRLEALMALGLFMLIGLGWLSPASPRKPWTQLPRTAARPMLLLSPSSVLLHRHRASPPSEETR